MAYIASTTRAIRYVKPGKDGADAVRYWLVPSHTSVRVKDGKATPAKVTCRLLKSVGEDAGVSAQPSDEGLAIRFYHTGEANTGIAAYTSAVNVNTDERYSALQFGLYRGSLLIDTCTVAIVRDGAPATQYYIWIRYADDAMGGGMSDSPVNPDGSFKAYIGIANNRTAATESDDPADYVWSRFMGEDGVSLYTWIRYSDGPLSGGYPAAMYDSPKDSTMYIGIAVNQTSPTKGGDPKAYSWSKFKGDDGTSVKIKDTVEKWVPTRSEAPDIGVKWAVDSPFAVVTGAQVNGKPMATVAEPEEGDIYRVESGDHAGHLICAASGRWVDLGEIQGPKGDPGEDAVSVEVTPPVVTIKKGTAGQQDVFVDVYEGKERIESGISFTPIRGLVGKSTLCNNLSQDGRSGYRFTFSATEDDNLEVPFSIFHKGVEYKRSVSVRTISDGAQGPQGRHGPALRVQRWEKCPVGFGFQSGGDGDEYKDVVVYHSDKDRYYECVEGHAKTASNDPVTSIQGSTGLWKAGTQLSLVATDILLAEYARIANLGVEVIDICDYDDRGVRTETYLYADREGLWCNYGEFRNIAIDSASVTNATITSGRIAGFDIAGNALTNSDKNEDAALMFSNSRYKCFAGIGGNVYPEYAGYRVVARFENDNPGGTYGTNIAVRLSASGAGRNFAFVGQGNGVLDGMVAGVKLSRHVVNGKNSVALSSPFNLAENNVWILHTPNDGNVVPLPLLPDLLDALGLTTGASACIRLTVVGDIGCRAIKLAGRSNDSYNGSKPYASESFPLIIDNNGGVASTLTLQLGDSFEFLLVYFPDDSRTKDGFSLKYTARVINHTN